MALNLYWTNKFNNYLHELSKSNNSTDSYYVSDNTLNLCDLFLNKYSQILNDILPDTIESNILTWFDDSIAISITNNKVKIVIYISSGDINLKLAFSDILDNMNKKKVYIEFYKLEYDETVISLIKYLKI